MVRIGCRCLLGLLSLGSAPLVAGTASGAMAVTVTVQESCRISTRPVAFGVVPAALQENAAQAPAVIACSPDARYLGLFSDARNAVQGGRQIAQGKDISGSQIAHASYVYWQPSNSLSRTSGETITITITF